MKQINQMIYMYIIEIETMLLMKYKIQLVDIESKTTMLDLQSFVSHLQTKTEQIEKSIEKSDNFNKALVYLRDTLNFMTLGDNRIR